ncbi:MAG: hypothetical protein HZB26_13980 [Candidatus Hydrogenedentes bacterium]|nr:hypothetical protein [Candidatus Hydrogenedentota bacterium]
MELVRQKDIATAVCSGPGMVKQDENGRLTYKVFSGQCADGANTPLAHWFNPGKVILSDDLYLLKATDIHGDTWEVKDTLPHVGTFVPGQPFVVHGTGSNITRRKAFPFELKGTIIELTFFDDFEYPCNTTTETERKVGGVSPGVGSSFDTAIIELGGHKVLFTRKDKTVHIRLESEERDDPHVFERTLIESLQFSFAKPFRRASLDAWSGDTELLELSSRPMGTVHVRVQSPIKIISIVRNDAFYNLMNYYFRHIKKAKVSQWHPISMHVYTVIESSEASIDAQALGVSVAVEGMLNDAFGDIGLVDLEYERSVSCANDAIASLPIEERHRDRMRGAIKSTLSPRATERLRQLAADGRVREHHIRAWQNLRNRWAHGSRPYHWPYQKIMDHIQTVTVLFNCLVFAAIGYEGAFTDYSEPVWYDRPYPESMRWFQGATR